MIARISSILFLLAVLVGSHVSLADEDDDDDDSPRDSTCTSWDVQDDCCPSGCAAFKGHDWPRADRILHACMQGLGCSAKDIDVASVSTTCECK